MSSLETYSQWARASTEALTLSPVKGEARVDSRILARHLGNQHRPLIALIDKYLEKLGAFGKVLFQKAPSENGRTGQKERFALLNENQAFFLLTVSRNSERVVDLKVKLVQAFHAARMAADQKREEYLPTYRELHCLVHTLASGSSNEKFVHMNINKMVNKVVGIEAGQRASMSLPKQSMLVVAQVVATNALKGAADHHEGYRRVQKCLQALAAVAKPELQT